MKDNLTPAMKRELELRKAKAEAVDAEVIDLHPNGNGKPKPTGELLKRRYPMTDLGNGERFADDHRGKVRFVNQWEKWIIWNGSCWKLDEDREAVRLASLTVRQMFLESWPEGGGFDEKLERHSLKSESRRSIQDLLYLGSAQEGIPINAAELDRDPMLFNLASGTLDLNRGDHRAARQEDFITKQSEISYDPAAECPAWLEFLDTIMAGNKDLIGFLQRLAGYCLTGSVKEQKLFLLYGEGSNGKSTFLNTLLHLWGGYGRKVPSSLLLSRKDGTASNELAELFGVRLAVASETGEGKKMAESLVKELTGGEKLTGRRLYEQFFSWEPSSKIILCTNHKPEISGNDYAIWRRVCLIPFMVVISEDDQDRDLPSKLLAEAPGILNWCLEGLRRYQKMGLVEPEEVTEAVTEYRNEMDRLRDFLEEKCVEKPFAEVRSPALRRAYEDWCQSNGETCLGAREFQNRLRVKGFVSIRRTQGERWWKGVGLKAEDKENG